VCQSIKFDLIVKRQTPHWDNLCGAQHLRLKDLEPTSEKNKGAPPEVGPPLSCILYLYFSFSTFRPCRRPVRRDHRRRLRLTCQVP
jgi:hypothetical protein